MTSVFKGWPERALAFYEGLEADNSKAYWLDHKVVYERDVRAPMEALLSDLQDEFGDSRLFRPYRDTRFSQDKSPYKTAIAAAVGQGYVSLLGRRPGGRHGQYHMEPDQLERYRSAVIGGTYGPPVGGRRSRSSRGAGLDVHAMETLKTAPRGFPKDHPRIGLLRMKGLVASRHWPPTSWLHTAAAKTHVVEVFRAAAPLLVWLDATSVRRAADTCRRERRVEADGSGGRRAGTARPRWRYPLQAVAACSGGDGRRLDLARLVGRRSALHSAR